jgi:ferredoxin
MIINGNYVEAQCTKTILELANERDILLKAHCKDGYCGECRCKVTKGRVNYKVTPIASTQSNEVFPCVAYAVSNDVVITQV